MPAILITLETLEPLLATSFQGDPNSDVSYDYIPGNMVRGALIGRYLRHHRQRELNLEDAEVNRLFFSDEETRYLNGYLLSGNSRTLPMPLSWRKAKGSELTDSGLTIYDFSIEANEQLESPKALSENLFWNQQSGSIYFHKPGRRVNIHNQRDRTKGRSSKKENNPMSEGAVFRYDAIDAGQIFQSVILCEEQDVATLELLLQNPDIKIGGSRSAGYGHAKLSYRMHKEKEPWQEISIPVAQRAEEEGVTITLLSNTLLRNSWGQPTADPNLLPTAINEVVGSNILESKPHIFNSSTLIGGFNRKWGLPLPQVPALGAGTVLAFEAGKLSPDQIRQLELQGIGERRNEGFGRVAVNCHSESSFTVYKLEADRPDDIPTISEKGAQKIAEAMATRLLRQKLERQLKKRLNDSKLATNRDGKLAISNSQLSRVGTAAREGLSMEGMSLEPISNLLNSLAKVATGQFKSARMEGSGMSFYDQLENWVKKPTSWMGTLTDLEVSLSQNISRTINADSAQSDELVKEYTLRLIAAVAKQAYKESTTQEAV